MQIRHTEFTKNLKTICINSLNAPAIIKIIILCYDLLLFPLLLIYIFFPFIALLSFSLFFFLLLYLILFLSHLFSFLRRFVWNFFRLENEHLNNCGQFRAVRDISIAPVQANDQVRLASIAVLLLLIYSLLIIVSDSFSVVVLFFQLIFQ